jgi:hypothetical protein
LRAPWRPRKPALDTPDFDFVGEERPPLGVLVEQLLHSRNVKHCFPGEFVPPTAECVAASADATERKNTATKMGATTPACIVWPSSSSKQLVVEFTPQKPFDHTPRSLAPRPHPQPSRLKPRLSFLIADSRPDAIARAIMAFETAAIAA